MSKETKIKISSPDDAAAEKTAAAAADSNDKQSEETADAAEAAEESAAEDIDTYKQQIADLTDKLQRAVAEQDNMRKRLEREKADISKYAISNFARDVLTVADNIQRAIEAVPRDAAEGDQALKSFLEGVEVTERELLKVMERHGISRLNPVGEKFDPNFHQAMFEVATADAATGTVVQVVQAGYMLGERVLRPALVGVAKAAPQPTDDKKDAAEADKTETPAKDEPEQPAKPSEEVKTAEAKTASASVDKQQPEDKPKARDKDDCPPRASRLSEPVIGAQDAGTANGEASDTKQPVNKTA